MKHPVNKEQNQSELAIFMNEVRQNFLSAGKPKPGLLRNLLKKLLVEISWIFTNYGKGVLNMFKPSRILVPIDMSHHSLRAMRKGFDIAKEYNAEIFLLHVIQNPVQEWAIDYCINEDLMRNLQVEMLESARKAILRLLGMFPSIDADKIATDVRMGVPYNEILNEAEEREIDLIVIANFLTFDRIFLLFPHVTRLFMVRRAGLFYSPHAEIVKDLLKVSGWKLIRNIFQH